MAWTSKRIHATGEEITLAELVRRLEAAEKEREMLQDAYDNCDEERTAAEARVTTLEEALEFIQAAAASWHGDDAAKGRALTVIADKARAALSKETP